MGRLVSELVSLAEEILVWLLLHIVLKEPPTFANVRDRRLTGLADDFQLDPSPAPETLRSQLLAYLRERDQILVERRKTTQEKLKTLLTISSGLVAVLGALSITDLLDQLILLPLALFVACSFLLLYYIADDTWMNFCVSSDEIKQLSADENAWSDFEIRGREQAWRNNEEVRGFLAKVYVGARRFFLLGFFSLLLLVVWASVPAQDVALQDAASQNTAPQQIVPQNVAPQNGGLSGELSSIEGSVGNASDEGGNGQGGRQTAHVPTNDNNVLPCGGLETALCNSEPRYYLHDPARHD